jgi:hypothetical protein
MTPEAKKRLLLMPETPWKSLKREVNAALRKGKPLPACAQFLGELDSEGWSKVRSNIDNLRETHKDTLEAKRAELKATWNADRDNRRREYMKAYMKEYRSKHGQGSTKRSRRTAYSDL